MAYGGGLFVSTGTAELSDGCFLTDTAALSASNQASGGGAFVKDGTLTATDSHFVRARARATTGSAHGGGVHVASGNAELTRVTLTAPSAYSDSDEAHGGGVYVAGGTINFNSGGIHEASARVAYHASVDQALGGGLFAKGGSSMLTETTIDNAVAHQGGGVFVAQAASARTVVLQRTRLYHNVALIGSAIGVTSSYQLVAIQVTIQQDCTAAAHDPLSTVIDGRMPKMKGMGGMHMSGMHMGGMPMGGGGLPAETRFVTLPLAGLVLHALQCPKPPILFEVQPMSCEGYYPTASGAMHGACGVDASCQLSSPSEIDDEEAIFRCACLAPAYPSPLEAYPLLAPYTTGCVRPMEIEGLTHEADRVLVTLNKGVVAGDLGRREFELSLRLSGTAWDEWQQRQWVVVVPRPTAWLTVMSAAGNFTRPPLAGQDVVVRLPVRLDSAGLYESAEPYEATVRLDVLGLPNITHARASIPVAAMVRAAPVAARCTLAAPATHPLSALVEATTYFRFTARDIEGLPVVLGSDASIFVATVRRCSPPALSPWLAAEYGAAYSNCTEPVGRDASLFVEHVGGGEHSVGIVLRALGRYECIVSLNGVALPFQMPIVGICGNGFYDAGRDTCLELPEGSSVDEGQGVSLATLQLAPNHWRLSPFTSDIRKCFSGVASSQHRQASACVGGTSASYCVANTTGPLCLVCVQPGTWYDAGAARCQPCAVAGVTALVLALGISLLVIGAVAATARLLHTRHLSATARVLSRVNQRLDILPKVKLFVSYFQIVLLLPELYSLPFPEEYYDAVHLLRWMAFDWIATAVPAPCTGDFRTQLLVRAIVPLVSLALLVSVGFVVQLLRPTGTEPLAKADAVEGEQGHGGSERASAIYTQGIDAQRRPKRPSRATSSLRTQPRSCFAWDSVSKLPGRLAGRHGQVAAAALRKSLLLSLPPILVVLFTLTASVSSNLFSVFL